MTNTRAANERTRKSRLVSELHTLAGWITCDRCSVCSARDRFRAHICGVPVNSWCVELCCARECDALCVHAHRHEKRNRADAMTPTNANNGYFKDKPNYGAPRSTFACYDSHTWVNYMIPGLLNSSSNRSMRFWRHVLETTVNRKCARHNNTFAATARVAHVPECGRSLPPHIVYSVCCLTRCCNTGITRYWLFLFECSFINNITISYWSNEKMFIS